RRRCRRRRTSGRPCFARSRRSAPATARVSASRSSGSTSAASPAPTAATGKATRSRVTPSRPKRSPRSTPRSTNSGPRAAYICRRSRALPGGRLTTERGTIELRSRPAGSWSSGSELPLKRRVRGTRGSPVLLTGLRTGRFFRRLDRRYRRREVRRRPRAQQARRDDLALAGFLRAVEGVIGPLEERDRVVVRLQLRDSGRDRERSRLADRPRRDRLLQARVELVAVGQIRLREDDRELVTADPARDVGRANDLAHPLGGLGEDAVAGEVADLVVDRLEVVEVEDDEREVAVVPVGARDLPGEGLVEVPPVVEARERVEV